VAMKFPKLIALVLCALFASALTSCNTFLGVGRDLQQAGEGIEKTVYGR
jgi:predicted small secreted protein